MPKGSQGGDGSGRLRSRSERGFDAAPSGDVTSGAEAPDPALAAPASSGSGSRRTFATHRPVAVGVVFLAASIFGWLSYFRLPVTLMPELAYPTLTVRTEYPGAAPEEVENDVSRPLEEALGVIGGLVQISSISRADVSDVVLEFSWDTAMSDAVQDTLEKLDQVLLPEEAERPLILRFDPSLDPVMELSLSGEGERFAGEEGLRRLRRLAELRVKRALEPIKGVAAVQVRGGLEEEIHVRLDDNQMERTGTSIERVIERLRQENVNVAGGTLKEGRTEYMVRTLNEYQDLEQIAQTVVTTIDGREVRVADLGEVGRAHKERQIETRTDGHESVQLLLFKEADANMVALAKRVRDALGELPAATENEADEASGEDSPKARRDKGGGLASQLLREEEAHLEVVADRSLFIESSIAEVRNTALVGGLLAVLVLYLFLRSGRSTAIIAASIPISLLVTFAPLNMLGVSLNIMSLGGLALGIGMLVDSSIVVLESIFRCREEGDGLVDSVVRGTGEVRGAVTASTLTSIAVFLPMVFVEGIAGQAFGDLGLAVVISLLASLLVALYLIPMLAAREGLKLDATGADAGLMRFLAWHDFRADLATLTGWRWLAVLYLVLRLIVAALAELIGKLLVGIALVAGGLVYGFGRLAARWLGPLVERGPLRWVGKGLEALESGYRVVLDGALRQPVLVVGLALASLVATGWAFWSIDSELLPEVHQGELTVEVALPPGTPLEETIAVLSPVEEAILAERGSIDSLLVTYGFDPAQSQRSDEGEHTARFKVLLERADPRDEAATVERLRRRFDDIPDLEHQVVRPVLFSFKTPIEVEVHADDLSRLAAQTELVRDRLANLPQLADVQATLRPGAPEVEILYDRELLARYGLSIGDVAERVRSLVRGREATRFNLKDRRIPIVVQLAERHRRTVEDVESLVVNPGGERPIRLASIAAVELGEGPSEVRRVDGRRVALVRANLAEGSLGAAVAAIEQALDEDVEWPSDMTYLLSGQSQEWERSAASLWLALGLSVFLVYVIMAAQFESLLHPLIILFSIPLAFFGTALTLLALGVSLSIVVFLGMIMLAGIVVNNAIVLVDYVNVLEGRGLPRREALLTAGTVRLRPILMTTATTVLGLLPMALGLGDGAEIRTPMAIAVISGLVASTVLTLLIIPTLYELAEGIKERLLRRLGMTRAPEGALAEATGATP